MGRSFTRATPASMVEDFARPEFSHNLSSTQFSMVARGGEFFQRRWQVGLDGAPSNIEEMKIDYVMGSGNHARSYLHRTARGTLIELPLGWYPDAPNAPTGHWGMSPGSDSEHPRTRRFVSYKCMFCHNAVPQVPAANLAPGSEPVFTGELPEGIDCQRCHGPGANHVKVVQARGGTHRDAIESIVNPARLSPERRMEICMQCHLETSSGRIPAEIVRFNRGPFSFKPGEPLANFMLTFDHAPGTGHEAKFEAVSSVYRLRQSRCFLKSSGALTCETCHDPHSAPRGAEAVAHYDGACMRCHARTQGSLRPLPALAAQGLHTTAADCASCHMPKRRAEDTPGMLITDHLIQKRKPAGDLLAQFPDRAPEQYRGEVVPYYPSPLPHTPLNDLYRAAAQVGLDNNTEAGLPVLARELARQKPHEAEFYKILSDGWLSAHRYPEAIAAGEEAVRLAPHQAGLLQSLARVLEDAGQSRRAAETLQQAARLDSNDPVSWHRLGLLDLVQGRTDAAFENVSRAIAIAPELPDQQRDLARILIAQGRGPQAEASLRAALATDPWDDAAWDLAGRLASEKGTLPEARFAFERAIRLRPRDATHRYDYSLALVRFQLFDEAERQIEGALLADSNLASAHELRGGLFERKLNWSAAAAEYRRVLELQPNRSRAQLRLGLALTSAGDTAGGAAALRAAAQSSDAMVASEASRALAQAGVH